jgi:hypothetical protein
MSARISLYALFSYVLLAAPGAAANGEVPDPALAPGVVNSKVTQQNISETICSQRWLTKNKPSRRFTENLKRKQLKAWKYDDRNVKNYVEDHVIPIEVGGHPTDPRNLWPQSATTAWNAATKDKLEEYVSREVCAERMPLKDAQAVFQKGWVEVFHVYCGAEPTDVCTRPGSPVLLENPKPTNAP